LRILAQRRLLARVQNHRFIVKNVEITGNIYFLTTPPSFIKPIKTIARNLANMVNKKSKLEKKAEKLCNTLEAAYQHVLRSGDAILAYHPEDNPSSLEEARELLAKIGTLYIDYQLLLACKRVLIQSRFQTLMSSRPIFKGSKTARRPRLQKQK
jgi:hypothetical protein